MAAAETPPKSPPPPRKQPRDARRVQLIEATIEIIAQRGFARTTLTEVARLAGLSHGLVNFHFQSKDGLLLETLLYLSEEYRQNWTEALAAAPSDPAAQIEAMLGADFNPAICTPARLSAWCAFWGETQSRPIYQERCGANDEEYHSTLEGLCDRLNALDGHAGHHHPARIARVLRVTTEGVWLDMMTMAAPYDLAEARATVMTCAAAFYPRQFSAAGRIG